MDWTHDIRHLKESIALLMQMARVDGHLDEREMKFIFDIGKMMKMTTAQIELAIAESDNIQLTIPSTEPQRMVLLYRLLFLMRIDNKVSDEEELLLRKIALKLGVRDTLVSDMIKLMRENLIKDVPPDAMLNNIRRYLN